MEAVRRGAGVLTAAVTLSVREQAGEPAPGMVSTASSMADVDA